jgi:hypothetical protein
MKKNILYFLFVFVFLLAGCNPPGDNQSGTSSLIGNTQPQAWIDAPLNESHLPFLPYEIVFHITAQQSAVMGEISIDEVLMDTIENPDPASNLATLRYMWAPDTAGKHIIRVRAQGSDGAWGNTSSAVVYIGEGTPTLTPTEDSTMILTTTPTPTTQAGFSNFSASPGSVYYGNCTPNQVRVSAQASDPAGITTVVLFYRMRNANGKSTDWQNAAMNPGSDDQYSKTIDLGNFTSPYNNGTLDIQLVIQNKNNEMVRSEVYSQVDIAVCWQPLFEFEIEKTSIPIIPLIPTKTPIIIK